MRTGPRRPAGIGHRQDGGRSGGQRTTNVGTKDGDATPWQDDERLGHELERGRDSE